MDALSGGGLSLTGGDTTSSDEVAALSFGERLGTDLQGLVRTDCLKPAVGEFGWERLGRDAEDVW